MKVAQISLEKGQSLTPLLKLPKNVGDLGKLLPKALKACPKSNKLPNLVSLQATIQLLIQSSLSSSSLRLTSWGEVFYEFVMLLNYKITVFLKNRPSPASFCLFSSFPHDTNQYNFIKAQMVCLGLEPGAAKWKAQKNPLSYGCTPKYNTDYYIATNLR